MRKPTPSHVPFQDSSGISNGLQVLGSPHPAVRLHGWVTKEIALQTSCLRRYPRDPAELQESFCPVLFSNLTQAQEHASKPAAHAGTAPGTNTGLPPPANMPDVDERFPWKDPFFSQDILSLFMGTTAISHQSNVPRDSPPLSSHFNLLIGKGICREEGWLVVVAVGMILPPLNKCEKVYRLKCRQF